MESIPDPWGKLKQKIRKSQKQEPWAKKGVIAGKFIILF